MLPAALQANRDVAEGALARLARYALNLPTLDDAAAADVLIERISDLGRRLEVPSSLGALRVRREQLPALVAGSHGNSLNGNPRPIGDEELHVILERLL